MGRVFLIEFDKIPENIFHLCSTCQAHIALFTDLNYFTDNELHGFIISSAINVHTLGPEQNRRVRDCVVADVHCNNCCDHLGIKFIEVRKDDARVKDKDFPLCVQVLYNKNDERKHYVSKLLMWDGTQVVYEIEVWH